LAADGLEAVGSSRAFSPERRFREKLLESRKRIQMEV
jgi:hypothetical protein